MYQFALRVDKHNAHANNNYAVMLAVARHDFERAIQYFRAATEASRDNPIAEHQANLEKVLRLYNRLAPVARIRLTSTTPPSPSASPGGHGRPSSDTPPSPSQTPH